MKWLKQTAMMARIRRAAPSNQRLRRCVSLRLIIVLQAAVVVGILGVATASEHRSENVKANTLAEEPPTPSDKQETQHFEVVVPEATGSQTTQDADEENESEGAPGSSGPHPHNPRTTQPGGKEGGGIDTPGSGKDTKPAPQPTPPDPDPPPGPIDPPQPEPEEPDSKLPSVCEPDGGGEWKLGRSTLCPTRPIRRNQNAGESRQPVPDAPRWFQPGKMCFGFWIVADEEAPDRQFKITGGDLFTRDAPDGQRPGIDMIWPGYDYMEKVAGKLPGSGDGQAGFEITPFRGTRHGRQGLHYVMNVPRGEWRPWQGIELPTQAADQLVNELEWRLTSGDPVPKEWCAGQKAVRYQQGDNVRTLAVFVTPSRPIEAGRWHDAEIRLYHKPSMTYLGRAGFGMLRSED